MIMYYLQHHLFQKHPLISLLQNCLWGNGEKDIYLCVNENCGNFMSVKDRLSKEDTIAIFVLKTKSMAIYLFILLKRLKKSNLNGKDSIVIWQTLKTKSNLVCPNSLIWWITMKILRTTKISQRNPFSLNCSETLMK